MKVLKFGGTSVGTPQRMKDVAQLINDGQQKIVVLSAMSGTTNSLVEISDYYRKRNSEAAGSVINKLRTKYMQHLEELYTQEETKQKTRALLEEIFIFLHSFAGCEFSDANEKAILAQGELMSTNMVTNYLQEQGVKLAVASNKYQKATEKIVSQLFPDIKFVSVQGQQDGVNVKPDPSIVFNILGVALVPKAEVLYVGDSGVDMETARRACVDSVGVTWGFRSEKELNEYHADRIVHRASDIFDIVMDVK